ncbi:MAG: DNA-binding protein [Alphaproteobacteria bacterium]|nr:DNA-binding protein [Alphaproteobacteria bacterium]
MSTGKLNGNLTGSHVERQNILNNPFAIQKVEENLYLGGIKYQGETIFTKSDVAQLLEIDERTIERYLSSHKDELTRNGYQLLQGKPLKDLKISLRSDIDVGPLVNTLGIFSFRAVLNLAMLLTESEKAKMIRSRILDIVIDVLTERVGGKTKYINQRDENYLPAAFQEENHRKEFTDAIDLCVGMPNWKYGYCTNAIYRSIFHEDAEEYRKVLALTQKDPVRDTMYAEVLTLIASYEAGLAYEIKQAYNAKGKEKLSKAEFDAVVAKFESHPSQKPLLNDVRTKMASRDKCFRDALHDKLIHYIQSVPEADFERFLGEKSKELKERILETKEVFERLKNK